MPRDAPSYFTRLIERLAVFSLRLLYAGCVACRDPFGISRPLGSPSIVGTEFTRFWLPQITRSASARWWAISAPTDVKDQLFQQQKHQSFSVETARIISNPPAKCKRKFLKTGKTREVRLAQDDELTKVAATKGSWVRNEVAFCDRDCPCGQHN